jgi:hypothetical protein
MSLTKLALWTAAAALLPAAPALAQIGGSEETTGWRTAPASITQRLAAAHASGADAAGLETAQARSALPQRGFFVRGFGGFWVGSGEGVVLGGGIAALPLRSDQHEINGNVAFQRVESTNGFGVDVNYLYNFRLEGGERFTPYVGAGINVAHFSSDTEAALQIGGGIKRPLRNGRELFVEAFFPFFYDTPLIARGGLAW